MMARSLQYRIAKSGLFLLTFLFDVTNAFPSIDWDFLEKKFTRDFTPSDERFLQLRHRHALCAVIDYLNKIAILRVGSGNRQGDGPASSEEGEG